MMILGIVRLERIMAMNCKKYDYVELVDSFGEDKIKERYTTLYEYMDSFIKRNKYENQVVIADSVLNQCIIDYFADVYRLKEFHNIEKINYVKIHAYTAYWLIRRKPLQIIKDDIENIDLAYILLETDSPYLTPEPYRKEKNSSCFIPIIAKKIAEIKNISLSKVVEITGKNANKCFKF